MDKEGLVRTAGFAAGYIVCAYAVGKLFTFALGNNNNNNNNNSDQDDMRFRVDKDQRRKNNSNKPSTNKKRRSSGANDNTNSHGDGENGVEVGDDVEDVSQQDELASLLNDHWAGEVPPELEEIIDILKYPEIYAKMGSSMPKGMLLHGDPGTGKTYFAKVLAQVTGSQFFSAAASQFDEIYVGRGPQRIRQLFEEAKQAAAAASAATKKPAEHLSDLEDDEDDGNSDDDDDDVSDEDDGDSDSDSQRKSRRKKKKQSQSKSRDSTGSGGGGWFTPSWWWNVATERRSGDASSTSSKDQSNASNFGQHMSIIFIDEIDALGTRNGPGGTADARHATLSQLLVSMDGMNSADNIFVIAATNNLSLLDPALLRSGRFDRIVKMSLPSEKSRLGIIRFYLKGKPGLKELERSGILARVAEVTRGFNCGDLKSLVNEASLAATRLAVERQKQLDRTPPSRSSQAHRRKQSKQALDTLAINETHLVSAFHSVYTKVRRERPQNELLPKRQVTERLQTQSPSTSNNQIEVIELSASHSHTDDRDHDGDGDGDQPPPTQRKGVVADLPD